MEVKDTWLALQKTGMVVGAISVIAFILGIGINNVLSIESTAPIIILVTELSHLINEVLFDSKGI